MPGATPEPEYVTLDTSVGSLTLELYMAHAPKVRSATEPS